MNIYHKKRPIKVLLLTAVFILLFLNVSARAVNIQVAPRRFIFSGDRPLTEEVNIFNSSEETVRVRVTTEPPEGQPEEQYLGDWIVVYPRVISIEPGQQRVVRFSLRPPEEEISDGEYRSLLFFEELPPEESAAADESDTDEIQIDFRLLTKIGINLYGQFGEIEHAGTLKELHAHLMENNNEDSQHPILNIKGDFINQGNAHLRMEAVVRIFDRTDKAQLLTEEESSFVVHRDAEDVFTTELELPEGIEEGRVEVQFMHNDQVSGESTVIETVETIFE